MSTQVGHRVSATYTRELLRYATLRGMFRQIRLQTFVVYGFSVIATAALLLFGIRAWYVGISVGAVIVSTVAIVAAFVIPYRQSIAAFDRLHDKTTEFEFTPDHWVVRSELGESTVAWSAIELIWCESRAWLVKLRGGSGLLTLPLDRMDEPTRQFLVAQVTRSGGRVD